MFWIFFYNNITACVHDIYFLTKKSESPIWRVNECWKRVLLKHCGNTVKWMMGWILWDKDFIGWLGIWFLDGLICGKYRIWSQESKKNDRLKYSGRTFRWYTGSIFTYFPQTQWLTNKHPNKILQKFNPLSKNHIG